MKTEQEVIRLYAGAAPGSEQWQHHEQENYSERWQTQVVFNVTDPTITVFASRGTYVDYVKDGV